jgi:Kazal-type serine protease inhibitor domain
MSHSRLAFLSLASFALVLGGALAPRDAAAAPRFCPEIYRPVCGVNRAGERQTYTNACFAHLAHARILHPGQCVGPICFFIFNPVCARVPGHKPQTYSSLCAAENANATLLHDGACK